MNPQPIPIEDLREQLEEFALHLKPGTTKGKRRIGTFDTLELTKLVEALIQTHTRLALINELECVLVSNVGVPRLDTVPNPDYTAEPLKYWEAIPTEVVRKRLNTLKSKEGSHERA